MHRLMQIVALIALAAPASAIEVTTTAGQLSSQIADAPSVTSLTVAGEMDARDFLYIASSLPQLTSLDLSGVSIVAYSDTQRPLTATFHSFDAGTLPQSMLMGMKLKQLTLPGSLVAIGTAALAGCDSLTSIVLPPTLTRIGDYAFSGTALQSVTIPATVQTVGRGAFAHCFSLQHATVNAATIGDYAFVGDSLLQTLQLGEQVRRIGVEAFHGTALTAFDASHATALDSLGNWSLASTPLTSLSLPAGMTQMGDGAFFGTTQLTAASLPSGLRAVPDYAFSGGSQIACDTLLLKAVTSIGDYAFYNWSNTRYFFIPATVTHLGTRAMAGMTGLEQIDIDATTVPTLGEMVWDGVDQPTVKLGTVDNTTADLYAAAEQWQDFYLLHDYLLGDVNGDGTVDIGDVNTLVAYVLGKNPDPFIIEAAELDGNGTIDVSDANGIVNIVLGKVEQSTVRRIQGRDMARRATTDDRVSIEPLSIGRGETRTIDVVLANSRAYSALQLDVTLPAGLEFEQVEGTHRTAGHQQLSRTHGDRTRVVSYSTQERDFASGDAIVRLRIRCTDELAPGAMIVLSDIVLAQGGKTWAAAGSSTPVSNTTGVDNLTATDCRAYTTGMTLVIEATEATEAQVVSLNGMVRPLQVPAGLSQWTDLPAGIYVIRLQGKSFKVSLQ